jgi:hypothetical protein
VIINSQTISIDARAYPMSKDDAGVRFRYVRIDQVYDTGSIGFCRCEDSSKFSKFHVRTRHQRKLKNNRSCTQSSDLKALLITLSSLWLFENRRTICSVFNLLFLSFST